MSHFLVEEQAAEDIIVGNIVTVEKTRAGMRVWLAEVEFGDHQPAVVQRLGAAPADQEILELAEPWFQLVFALERG